MLFLLPFAGVGVLMLALTFQQVGGWWRTSSWKEYPATIQSVELQENCDSEGTTTYRVQATYTYQVDGQQFTGSRVSLTFGSDNVGDFHLRIYQEIKRHHELALPFRCFVNPSDPVESILYRDLRPGLIAFYLLFVSVFGGIGAIGLVALYRHRGQTRDAAVRFEQFPDQPWMWEEATPQGQYLPHLTWVSPVIGCLIGAALAVGCPLFLGRQLLQLPWAFFGALILVVGASQIYLAVRSTRRRLLQGVPRLAVTPWPLRVGSRAHLELSCDQFPPAGTELTASLEVIVSTSSEESQALATATATAPVPQYSENWTCEIDLPAGVPRSAGLLDQSGFQSGVWTLHITQPGDKWGFDAKYTLCVY